MAIIGKKRANNGAIPLAVDVAKMPDGTARITIGDSEHRLTTGQTIVMPAGVPHALFALEPFQMLLTVVFPH